MAPVEGGKGKGGKRKAAEPNLKRSASDFQKFCDEVTDETTHCKASVKELFASLKKWIDGGVADKTLWNRINAF